jgi:hypothetical protein
MTEGYEPDWGDNEPADVHYAEVFRRPIGKPVDTRSTDEVKHDANQRAYDEWASLPEAERIGTEPLYPYQLRPITLTGANEPPPLDRPSTFAALSRFGARPADASPSITAPAPFAVEGLWVAGSKGVIAGQDKDGKSTTALELALSLATGSPMYGIPEYHVNVEPTRVLYLQSENDEAEQMRRYHLTLHARGLDSAPNLWFVPQAAAVHFDFSTPVHEGGEARKRLECLIEEARFGYVFFDPLYDMIGSADIQGRSGQIQGVLAWLTSLQARYGCAPIVTTQLQQKAGYGVRSIAGDTTFRYWLETALLTKRSGSKFTVTRSADRHGYGTRVHHVIGTGLGSWEQSPAAGSTPGSEPNAQQETMHERLALVRRDLTAYPDGTITERVERLGLRKRTLERDIARIRREDEAAT